INAERSGRFSVPGKGEVVGTDLLEDHVAHVRLPDADGALDMEEGVGLLFVKDLVELVEELDASSEVEGHARLFDDLIGALVAETDAIATAGLVGLARVPDLVGIALPAQSPAA